MKVLIIDDEDIVRKSLVKAFVLNGHEVYEAAGGQMGLEVWQSVSPDVVLLDVLMPDLTGPQLLTRVSSVAKVLLMSAYKGKYDHESAKSLGADDFLTKPFDDIFAVVRVAEQLFEKQS